MWRWPGEVVVADVGVCRQDMFGHVCEPCKRWCQQSLGCRRVEFRAEFCAKD